MTESWQEVGDRIYRRRHRSFDLNVGLVVGEDGALVVDSRANHREAQDLRQAIAARSALPIRWLVNTHYHWDHTFGNAVFADALIVGHRRCREVMLEEGEQRKRRLVDSGWYPAEARSDFEDVVVTPPRLGFDRSLQIDLGGRVAEVRHLGAGHTDSDVVVFVDDVCFAGDLVEDGAPPAFGDSLPGAWVETLERLIPLLPATVVPGHGDVVDPGFVRAQRAEIAAAIEAAGAGSGPVEGATAESPYPPEVMEMIADRRRQEVSS